MSPLNDHPPESELSALAAALGGLRPSASRLDRDRLMFETGQAAARRWFRSSRLWPALAAALACLAVGEAFLLGRVGEPQVIERVVIRTLPAARAETTTEPTKTAKASETDQNAPVVILKQRPIGQPRNTADVTRRDAAGLPSYALLRRDLLRFGLDALPEPPPIVFRASPEDNVPASTSTPPLLRRQAEIDALLNPGESS